MRISDWSSDVCSSDLVPVMFGRNVEVVTGHMRDLAGAVEIADLRIGADEPAQLAALMIEHVRGGHARGNAHQGKRKETNGRLPGRDRLRRPPPKGRHEIEPENGTATWRDRRWQ